MDQHLLQVNKLAMNYDTNRDLVKLLVSWFGVKEIEKILKMKPINLRKTLRVNLLKVTRTEVISRLFEENITCVPIKKLPEGLTVIRGWEKVGSSQSYLVGEIMPQGLGSMLAVEALNPKPGEVILDMASAPGGKSCFIGERLKRKGILIANDKSLVRTSALINNLTRHGIDNAIIIIQDALKLQLPQVDRILLDAPCSGDGLIVSQTNRRKLKTILNSYHLQKIQIGLLKKALRLVKPGGVCVYSTCSLTPIENEEVILSILNEAKLVEIQIPGIPGISAIHSELEKAKRLLPTTHLCDGFFIAKILKSE